MEKHGQKGFPARFLLADSRQRHGANREILQRMLVLREANPLSGPGALDHPHYMDVCHMGPRLLGAIQESSWGLDPPAHHNR
jgi:hypothetical protein